MNTDTLYRPRRLLTVNEVADRWNCSPRHVWRLIQLGKLATLKVGPKTTRVEESAADAYEHTDTT